MLILRCVFEVNYTLTGNLQYPGGWLVGWLGWAAVAVAAAVAAAVAERQPSRRSEVKKT